MNGLALCSGLGGLEIGLAAAIPGYRDVCHVEREATVAAVLAARMADQAISCAPIWTDLRTFDGRPWRGIVQVVSGGIPCQPWSTAGKRKGATDERHLWPDAYRIIREVQPAIVFIENVGGSVRDLGEGLVRPDLERIGFRTQAGIFTAQEVGAPHRRERLFILGVADYHGGRWQGERGSGEQGYPPSHAASHGGSMVNGLSPRWPEAGGRQREHPRPELEAGSRELADTRHGPGSPEQGEQQEERAAGTRERGAGVGDTDQPGPQGRSQPERSGGNELPAWPPGPSQHAEWQRVLAVRPDLAPALPDMSWEAQEGMAGLARNPRLGLLEVPEGDAALAAAQNEALRHVRNLADGLPRRLALSRTDQLRALGNAVVPAQAELAFRTLWSKLHAT